MNAAADVRHEPDTNRFILPIADGAKATAYYQTDANARLVLTHTEVPDAYMGKGIGSALAQGVFDHARANGETLVLRCTFMIGWFKRHPDYSDVVADDRRAAE